MPIKRGNTSIAAIYRGDKKIAKVYRGEECVYQSGPTFVDWIKLDGDSYIVTSIDVDATTRLVFKGITIEQGPLYGWIRNGDPVREWYMSNNSKSFYGNFYTSIEWILSNSRYSLDIDFQNAYIQLFRYPSMSKVDNGHAINMNNFQYVLQHPQIFVGKAYDSSVSAPYGTCKATIRGLEIHKGGALVADLQPSYYKGEYGLYDIVSHRFYGNSGTGTITGGFDQ